MNTEIQAMGLTPPLKTLIAFATRWGAQFGGINSFNQDLLIAFAAACYQDVTTICVVLTASEEELQNALNEQVRLVSLDCPEQNSLFLGLEAVAWQKLREIGISIDPGQTVWLGHDRITGAIAIDAAQERGGRSALIHHMSYSRYESFAESSATAKQKEEEQRHLFKRADVVMAVGPLLGDALADMRNDEEVLSLVPGLPDIIVRGVPKSFKGFLSGRLSDDARRIKQAHLGVAAFANSIRQADENAGLPNALRGENEPMLVLRGVDFENSSGNQHVDAEMELKLFAEEYAGRAFNLQALPFTTDRKTLFDDLRSASVAMMPSWHEGFGLVAWEAIAAGVPLIISNKSGAYRLLKDFENGLYTSCVISIDVAGSSSAPYFLPKDVSNLAQALISIAKDPKEARQRAARLREALISKFTWADCARQVADVLGWGSSNIKKSVVVCSNSPQLPQPLVLVSSIELPRARWQSNSGLSDSQLLRAEEAIVPFDLKREPFLTAQVNWAESLEYPVALRLLTGVGGVGKTRLALEMCRRLQDQGWLAGFLLSDFEAGQAERLVDQIVEAGQPFCVVIDYAETRQTVLLAVLKALMKNQIAKSVRIVLLARDGGEWWRTLPAKDASCEALLEGEASSGPFTLPQLHDSESERQEAYRLALNTFSTLLGVNAAQHSPDLTDEHFALPLYIQMAALMALRGERPRSAEALQRAVVNHEKRYWGKLLSAGEGETSEHERQAAVLMTLATFSNGVATERSIETAWELAGEDKSRLRKLFKVLASLYPDRQGLQGLRPDLIGEALVAQSLLGLNGSELLDVVLYNEKRLRQTSLTVLARLLRNRTDLASMLEDALTKKFLYCVDEVIAVCIETPSPLPDILERAYKNLSPSQQSQAAGVLSSRFEFEILPLTGLDVLVSQSISYKKEAQNLKKKTHVEASKYASALKNLSVAYVRDGRTEEALAAVRRAVEVYQEVAKVKPELYKPGWASALTQYANCLGDQGQTVMALAASRTAVEIYQELDRTKPGAFKSNLAMSLHNYANCLDSQGALEDSLVAAKDALNLYRELAQSDPVQFIPDVAMALNNYGNYLDSIGSDEEALTVTEEALAIYRELAQGRPERFRADLAMSLNNYANHLIKQDKINDALVVSEEALAIFQELSEAKPERFRSDVGMALSNYGSILDEQGRREDALTAIEGALVIYKELALASPERFRPDLALTLMNYTNSLSNHGKAEEALMACQKALGIYELLAEINPGYYLPFREKSRLGTLVWRWLVFNENTLEELKRPLANIVDLRKQREVEFQQIWLLAWFERDLGSVFYALYYFTTLDLGQQHMNKWAVYLLVVLTRHRFGVDSVPDYWCKKSERYREQKQDNFPCWVVEMIRRADSEL